MPHQNFSISSGLGLWLVDLGLRPGDVLRRAGLPADLLSRADASVCPSEYYRLWDAIAEDVDNPALPVTVIEAMSAESFDVAIFASLCCRDLNAAALRLRTFKPVIGPLRINIDVSETKTTVRPDWSQAGTPPTQLAIAELLFWVGLVRLATRTRVVPVDIIGPASEASDAYSEYLGINYRAGSDHHISFAPQDAERPFLTANEPLLQQFEPALRNRLEDLTNAHDTTAKVSAALVELLPAGATSIHAAAQRLAVSPRTLQRQLSGEGTSFQQVLAGVRERLARHYLATDDIPVAQISYLLGYEEPTSFGRAFTAWTGISPNRHRARIAPRNRVPGH